MSHGVLDVGKGLRETGRFPTLSCARQRALTEEGARGGTWFPRGSEAKPSDVEHAMRIVEGTARSMGVEVAA